MRVKIKQKKGKNERSNQNELKKIEDEIGNVLNNQFKNQKPEYSAKRSVKDLPEPVH